MSLVRFPAASPAAPVNSSVRHTVKQLGTFLLVITALAFFPRAAAAVEVCERLVGEERDFFTRSAIEYAKLKLSLAETDILLYDPVACGDGTVAIPISQRTRLRNWTVFFAKQSHEFLRVEAGE